MSEITISQFKEFYKKPKGLVFMENALKNNDIYFTREYKFCPDRKFRSDIFFGFDGDDDKRYLVEYEGLPLRGAKSGHITIAGYTSNCEKYNLACLMGYKVLRYTALNYKQFELDLQKILK